MRKTGHSPLLIVIAGPNGSGKTTITSEVIASDWMEDAVYINPDNVALERFGDWNSEEAVLAAARFCEQWREDCKAQPLFRLRDGIMRKQYVEKLPEWAKNILPD